MLFVLIVLWSTPFTTGGIVTYSNPVGGTVQQEFNTETACEYARMIFERDVSKDMRYLRSMCVPKG